MTMSTPGADNAREDGTSDDTRQVFLSADAVLSVEKFAIATEISPSSTRAEDSDGSSSTVESTPAAATFSNHDLPPMTQTLVMEGSEEENQVEKPVVLTANKPFFFNVDMPSSPELPDRSEVVEAAASADRNKNGSPSPSDTATAATAPAGPIVSRPRDTVDTKKASGAAQVAPTAPSRFLHSVRESGGAMVNRARIFLKGDADAGDPGGGVGREAAASSRSPPQPTGLPPSRSPDGAASIRSGHLSSTTARLSAWVSKFIPEEPPSPIEDVAESPTGIFGKMRTMSSRLNTSSMSISPSRIQGYSPHLRPESLTSSSLSARPPFASSNFPGTSPPLNSIATFPESSTSSSSSSSASSLPSSSSRLGAQLLEQDLLKDGLYPAEASNGSFLDRVRGTYQNVAELSSGLLGLSPLTSSRKKNNNVESDAYYGTSSSSSAASARYVNNRGRKTIAHRTKSEWLTELRSQIPRPLNKQFGYVPDYVAFWFVELAFERGKIRIGITLVMCSFWSNIFLNASAITLMCIMLAYIGLVTLWCGVVAYVNLPKVRVALQKAFHEEQLSILDLLVRRLRRGDLQFHVKRLLILVNLSLDSEEAHQVLEGCHPTFIRIMSMTPARFFKHFFRRLLRAAAPPVRISSIEEREDATGGGERDSSPFSILDEDDADRMSINSNDVTRDPKIDEEADHEVHMTGVRVRVDEETIIWNYVDKSSPAGGLGLVDDEKRVSGSDLRRRKPEGERSGGGKDDELASPAEPLVTGVQEEGRSSSSSQHDRATASGTSGGCIASPYEGSEDGTFGSLLCRVVDRLNVSPHPSSPGDRESELGSPLPFVVEQSNSSDDDTTTSVVFTSATLKKSSSATVARRVLDSTTSENELEVVQACERNDNEQGAASQLRPTQAPRPSARSLDRYGRPRIAPILQNLVRRRVLHFVFRCFAWVREQCRREIGVRTTREVRDSLLRNWKFYAFWIAVFIVRNACASRSKAVARRSRAVAGQVLTPFVPGAFASLLPLLCRHSGDALSALPMAASLVYLSKWAAGEANK
ncbi:unnamed protein product [Amoebophrya sp. A25]|nr:unnamed protein product [Amoebophrya sp. A25]|eukprot:GSA25T00002005001.1